MNRNSRTRYENWKQEFFRSQNYAASSVICMAAHGSEVFIRRPRQNSSSAIFPIPRLFSRNFSLFFFFYHTRFITIDRITPRPQFTHSFHNAEKLKIEMGGRDGWMRATVLKQTGRNVAAFRRFYSSIDRAALPAPFPCLYRPFPCSPLLSSPFLPFLPPLSRFFFVPSLSLSLYLRSSWSPRSPPRFNAIFLSLSALRATNRRN